MSLYPVWALFVATFLMGCLWQSAVSAGYQCYICSWSPRDNNRTDNCTDENFDARNVHSDSCDHGCEAYVQWDPNGSLDQWRRNCVRKSSAMTGDCRKEQTVAWQSKRCTCQSDYCNSASSSRLSLTSLLPFALFIGYKKFCR